jgi:ribosome-binding protein aMBF1 (putative translation factor)
MGHFCRICGRTRPNERFSGRGHRTHVCRDCARMPAQERELIEQEQEVFGYLKQSHISDKNLQRLRTLAASAQPRVRELAAIVLAVAEVKPYKKRRLKVLARERPDLLDALERTGLIMAHHWE